MKCKHAPSGSERIKKFKTETTEHQTKGGSFHTPEPVPESSCWVNCSVCHSAIPVTFMLIPDAMRGLPVKPPGLKDS